MKILHLGKFYYPEFGGIETVVQSLAEGLAARGDQVTVLCFSKAENFFKDEVFRGVRIVRVRCQFLIFSQPLSLEYVWTLFRLAREHDVVHLHGPNPFSEVLSLFLRRAQPRVYSYHADIVDKGLLGIFYRPFLAFFLRQVNAVVVATRSLLKQSRALAPVQKRCRIIPYGLPQTRFGSSPAILPLPLQGKRFFLFVGRLVPYKGVSVLLDAVHLIRAQLQDLTLIVVGDGPLKEDLKERAESLGLGDYVTFVGRVEDSAKLQGYYAGCEFLVLPSVSSAEALGMVLLEAMAHEKPVISSRLETGVIEANLENVTGFHVPPRDPQALSEAILRFARDPELRQRMGKAGRAHLDSHFSISAMVSKHHEIYSQFLESPLVQ